jgi:UDP-N-acetylmuramate dehydrogenase
MIVETNVSLHAMNTFGLSALAHHFVRIGNVSDLQDLRKHTAYADKPWFILGGGSNLLFTRNPESPVVQMRIPGVTVFPAEGDFVRVQVGAGVVWHDLVEWSLENNIFGLENLSLIPGFVGASPIQNIGAYGVELTQVFDSLQAFDPISGVMRTFDHAECNFGYRSSIFKTELKGRYVIVSVTFRLRLKPDLRLDYGDINAVLASSGIRNPSPKDVSKAVISIRQSKLPDPAQIGNAGSFFKNPEIASSTYTQLLNDWPDLPGYPISDQSIKVPAGWLIDRLGWKGHRNGDAGVHARQALVLVNYGNASGEEIAALSRLIQQDVLTHFGIELETEVNII